jgi:hypothetical protein
MTTIPFLIINNELKTLRYLKKNESNQIIWNFMYDQNGHIFGFNREMNKPNDKLLKQIMDISEEEPPEDGVLLKPMKVYVKESINYNSNYILFMVTFVNTMNVDTSIIKKVHKNYFSDMQWKWLVKLAKSETKFVYVKDWLLDKVLKLNNEDNIFKDDKCYFIHLCL